MKKVAIVFSQSPHGCSAGREGLDALLALSALTEEIGIFFISDGVLQLLPEQRPAEILSRDYISTFGVLPLYDIDRIYVCQAALQERGISLSTPLILQAELLPEKDLRNALADYDIVMNY